LFNKVKAAEKIEEAKPKHLREKNPKKYGQQMQLMSENSKARR